MRYFRRAIWYAATRLFLICLILGLIVTVFYYSMNITNIYVVTKDGMARRAQTVMCMDDGTDLSKFFSQRFLENDAALQSVRQGTTPYVNYNVRGIDHRIDFEFAWIWPWEDSVRVNVTERIPRIDGRAKGTVAEALVQAGGSEALYPPKWTSARYRLQLKKENDAWHITGMTLLNVVNK